MTLEDSNVQGNSKNESISGTCEGQYREKCIIGERSISPISLSVSVFVCNWLLRNHVASGCLSAPKSR